MRRISMKTGMKAVAVALIAFPEPITTALGILILSASFTLHHRKDLGKFGDPEVLIQRSLKNTEPIGFRRYLITEKTVGNHVPPQYYSWFDNHKMSQSVLHHTLKTSYTQYQSQSRGTMVHSKPVLHQKLLIS
jgi:hypothetical protein